MIGFPPLSTLSSSLFLGHAYSLAITCRSSSIKITTDCRNSRKPAKNPTVPQSAFLKSTSLFQRVFDSKHGQKRPPKRPPKNLNKQVTLFEHFFSNQNSTAFCPTEKQHLTTKKCQNASKCQGAKNKKK